MKKRLLKITSLLLCFVVASTVLGACGGAKDGGKITITNTYLSFKSANVGYTTETPINNSNVRFQLGNVVVTVPSKTTAIVLNLHQFFEAYSNVLGENTSFTRSDRIGTGYVYDLVGLGYGDPALRSWVKHGQDASNPANVKLHNSWATTSPQRTGLAIFNFSTGEVDVNSSQPELNRAEINFFAKRNISTGETDAQASFGDPDTRSEFTLTIKGHNGNEYKLELVIEVEPEDDGDEEPGL